MTQLTFYLNLTLTTLALLLVIIENVFKYNSDCSIALLMFLGFFQVMTSIVFTFYAVAYNKYLLILYIIYWIFLALFFRFYIDNFFYTCIVLAIHNLYANYCSFSNSKFNILNK